MIEADFSSLKETSPGEYAVRFIFGGAATVLAGLVAKYLGPGPGGLFLAFPAIFPASATLIEAHEKKRMAKVGSDGTNRGRMEASIDAAGAALGCLGLAGFALILWRFLPTNNTWLVLFLSVGVWMAISVVLWEVRKSRPFRKRPRRVQ